MGYHFIAYSVSKIRSLSLLIVTMVLEIYTQAASPNCNGVIPSHKTDTNVSIFGYHRFR